MYTGFYHTEGTLRDRDLRACKMTSIVVTKLIL